jgi:hypothetical protein
MAYLRQDGGKSGFSLSATLLPRPGCHDIFTHVTTTYARFAGLARFIPAGTD